MYELMSQDNPDMDAVQKQLMKIANIEANMKFSQIKVWMDAKSLLTDEQKAMLKKMMKGKMTEMMGEKKEYKSEKSGMKGMMGK